jgi:DNA-directed RNA polymerase specialized sigma24 family protein
VIRLDAHAIMTPADETFDAFIIRTYYLGFSFIEIGRSLSLSANTVASRCRYALAALRRRFARAPESNPDSAPRKERNSNDRL